jgi:outer membrane protein OmpA-like peptidoglycan-associated protein
MRGRYRMTTWIAVADFFVALAVVSFALFATHRSGSDDSVPIEEEVKRLVARLRDELQKNDVDATTRPDTLSIILPSIVVFESGKAAIVDDSQLQKVAEALKRVQDGWRDSFVLIVRGYTDSRPPRQHAAFRNNLELSRWRARAVEEQLDLRGIQPPRFQLVSQGMGAADPVVKNCLTDEWIDCGPLENFRSAEELEKNRRIELKFGVFTGNSRVAADAPPSSPAPSSDGHRP